MNDVIFFFKMLVLTVAIVIASQIQVGQKSLESHAMTWVQSSSLVRPLNGTVQGGAKLIKEGKEKLKRRFSGWF